MFSLAKLTKKRQSYTVINFEPSCLFINYAGCDALTMFFKNIKLLERVIDWLEERTSEVNKAILAGPD